MASLTEVAVTTKKLSKISVLLIVSFFVLKIGSKMFITYWKAKNPPQPPAPAMRFGKIPKLQLSNIVSTADITYKLETPTNTLPTLSDRANVYYSPYSKPNLLALEKAKKQALLLGFSLTEKKLSEKEYQWQNQEGNTTLTMNIFDGSFTIKYAWEQDQALLVNRPNLNESSAKTTVQRVLSQAVLSPEDIDSQKAIVTFLKISGQKLIPAVSQSEANLVQVNIYRQDINKLPVNTTQNNQGVIQIILSGSSRPVNGLVYFSYAYFPIDYGTPSDYPLKNAAALWNQFSAGGGYIISPVDTKPKEVVIRRVYLGYLDTLQPQKFIQPVLFLEGDNGFIGFTPALSDSVFQ